MRFDIEPLNLVGPSEHSAIPGRISGLNYWDLWQAAKRPSVSWQCITVVERETNRTYIDDVLADRLAKQEVGTCALWDVRDGYHVALPCRPHHLELLLRGSIRARALSVYNSYALRNSSDDLRPKVGWW